MDWFRVYHGIATNPKLHKASRRAKVCRGLMLGAWVATLEYASQHDRRGSVQGLDEETLAYLIDQPRSVSARILAAMTDLRMIADGAVCGWEEKQRKSDDVAARVRSFRAKSAGSGSSRVASAGPANEADDNSLVQNETDSSGNVTETNRTEQNRGEEKANHVEPESHEPAAPASKPMLAALYAEMVDYYGGNPARPLLGKWKNEHGIGRLVEAYAAARKIDRPDDPLIDRRGYTAGILEKSKEAGGKGNGGFPGKSGASAVKPWLAEAQRKEAERLTQGAAKAKAKSLARSEGLDERQSAFDVRVAHLTREILDGRFDPSSAAA